MQKFRKPPRHRLARSFVVLGIALSGSPANALEISVRAFGEQGQFSNSYGALMTVGVDLERFFSPSPGLLERPADPAGFEEEPQQAAADAGRSSEGLQPEALPPVDPSNGLTIQDRLARVALSPAALERLLRACLAPLRARGGVMDSLGSRMGSSAWLPELRLRAGHNTDQTLRLTPTDADPNRYQVSGAADLRLEAQATWKLHRLIFASEEIPLERLRTQLADARQKRTSQLLELLFAWQVAVLKLTSPELSEEERLRVQLSALQAAMALDSLTDAQFSRELDSHAKASETSRPPGQ